MSPLALTFATLTVLTTLVKTNSLVQFSFWILIVVLGVWLFGSFLFF